MNMRTRVLTAGLAALLLILTALPAQAVSPTPRTLYQLPGNGQCTKGFGNCAGVPKAAALPNGRLVAGFEKATVGPSGTAVGQVIPVYKSDDDGTTWQWLSDVRAPAYLSNDPAYARYTSNWASPYFYVLPQNVGGLAAGTLLLSTVVTGEDVYYTEQKAADPDWVPTNDGDRRDMAIGLYASTDQGASWTFLNIITTGGRQGGSAGAIGRRIARANTYQQVDPVWEPYLMVYGNRLVAYYSDENDYTGYNPSTGVLTMRPDNGTAGDSHGQVLAHRTWNGNATSGWSAPVLDVAGLTQNVGGVGQIGGGRPGMPNVVPTTDGRWMLTYEYFGGGDNVRYKISSNPLTFFAVGGEAGTNISALPVTSGSPALVTGGSPVIIRLPDGRLLYNAAAGGDVWVNPSGSSTGAWTRQHTTMQGAYFRNLTPVPRTGRVLIVGGFDTIRHADIDFGRSAGAYYKLINRKSGKALDAYRADLQDGAQLVQWADNGGYNQHWHVTDVGGGYRTLFNRNSGRTVSIWQTSTADGANAVQWVENNGGDQQWELIPAGSYYKIRARHSGKVLSVWEGATTDGARVVQWTDNGGLDQQWQLVPAS
ncbi:RICIN domain-containing protein [Nonomuraea phyllanthi]|uniref:RICIN domain-containing protein n=1 Tax=Nonomuraea phyllanthi TaxID=2219224 RepID=UPI001D159261|nr:RICIN domain-containing protein [Nonomuraea phyllanthi]